MERGERVPCLSRLINIIENLITYSLCALIAHFVHCFMSANAERERKREIAREGEKGSESLRPPTLAGEILSICLP